MFIGLSAFNITGFNRTFMELKCPNSNLSSAIDIGFNRTFMELKLGYKAPLSKQPYVSIVPLWN